MNACTGVINSSLSFIKIVAPLGGPTRPNNPSIYDQSLFILDYNIDNTVILRCHLNPGIFFIVLRQSVCQCVCLPVRISICPAIFSGPTYSAVTKSHIFVTCVTIWKPIDFEIIAQS